ncbi:vasotab-like [Stomoxys calcitrans]|uniref:Kazal-like domain-containing protein n=1 Tax=Stomoxys calcitrans TaxID=35570 RepID=A0A1I8PCG8_STOCA|nr:vasotab-like [Stomoxys calcitrans]
MHFFSIFLFFTLALMLGQVKANGNCQRICTREYDPVCGILRGPGPRIVRCTFGNPCAFEVHNCLAGRKWGHVPRACPRDSLNCRDIIRS